MKELDNIIEGLKNLRKLKELKISDEIIFDNAVKIFISNRINEEKFPNFPGIKVSEPLKNEQSPGQEKKPSNFIKPTLKQIIFMEKHKIEFSNSISKNQAANLINKYIEEHPRK